MKIADTKVEVIKGDITALDIDTVVMDLEAPKPSDQEAVRAASAKALHGANSSAAESIAFPALGVKSGFPPVGSAKILTQEILKFLKNNKTTLKKIVVCLSDDEIFKLFKKQITGYIDHIQKALGDEPYITVDIIIELSEGIVLIERSNPPYGWALPGGFVDQGEALKEAAIREAKEETNMDLEDVREFKTYDEPGRDPRFQTNSTVFIAKGVGTPQFGDDAKGLKVVPYEDLIDLEYAFDHNKIIKEYLNERKK